MNRLKGILTLLRGCHQHPQVFSLGPERENGQIVFRVDEEVPLFLIGSKRGAGQMGRGRGRIHDPDGSASLLCREIDLQDQDSRIVKELVPGVAP